MQVIFCPYATTTLKNKSVNPTSIIFHLLHDNKVPYNALLNIFKFNETQTMIENNTGSSIQSKNQEAQTNTPFQKNWSFEVFQVIKLDEVSPWNEA